MALYKTLVKKVSIPPDKKTKQKQYEVDGELPIIDQGKKLIGGYSNDKTMKLECELPVIIFGDHTCAVKYINFPFGAGADGIKVLEPKKTVLPKYLYYGTQYLTLRFPDKGYARHYQHIEKMNLTIPPLPEQERIVTHIEELFSELDNAVETLQTTKQQLAVYRQAVLKEAFSEMPFSEYRPLREIMLNSPQNGLYKPKSDYGSGVRILRIDGFYNGFILPTYDFKRLQVSQEEISRYSLKVNDLVVNRVNSMPYLGKCALVRKLDETTVFESNMMRFRLNDEIVNSEYVTYYLSSLFGKKELTKNAKQAVNQASINQTDVGNALIPVPIDVLHQKKVVEIIESRLSVCESIEQTVDTALAQADAMRQSILKQAFEGGFNQ